LNLCRSDFITSKEQAVLPVPGMPEIYMDDELWPI